MRSFHACSWGFAALAVHAIIGLALPSVRARRSVAPASLTIAVDVRAASDAPCAPAAHGSERFPERPEKLAHSRRASSQRDFAAEVPARRARATRDVVPSAPLSSEPAAPGQAAAAAAVAAPASQAAGARLADATSGASGRAAPSGDLGGGSDDAAPRAPRLLAFGSPCSGLFPAGASASHGEVQLALDVDAHGHARANAVLAELPAGQGFGSAARACAQRLFFEPAVTRAGAPAPSRAKVKLRFDRR